MKDPEGLEGICEVYDGAEFEVLGDEIDFVSPTGSVALNTVVYVQGRGLSIRAVSVPGSDEHMFFEQLGAFGYCSCMPAAVWHFTGVAYNGAIHTIDTLDGHEAVHLLRHPDHIIDRNYDTNAMQSEIKLIHEDLGLNVVFRELQDAMTDAGVLPDEGNIRVEEVVEVDTEEMFAKFMEMLGDDA